LLVACVAIGLLNAVSGNEVASQGALRANEILDLIQNVMEEAETEQYSLIDGLDDGDEKLVDQLDEQLTGLNEERIMADEQDDEMSEEVAQVEKSSSLSTYKPCKP